MREKFISDLRDFVATDEQNYLDKNTAMKEEYIGTPLFEEPIFGFGDANDPMFANLKDKVIGDHYKLPHEWNDKAKTIISVFLPLSEAISKSNALDCEYPSDLWLHGRIEGQKYMDKICAHFIEYFENLGYKTIAPSISPDFFCITRNDGGISFTSNWSERHTAFICGLGTFGLSKGIITEKGMAGRLISFITEAEFTPTVRTYTEIYEHCTMCGACVKRCPAEAITLEHGKNHIICSDFISIIKVKSKPWFGCGKCQAKVPCTRRNPSKKRA